MMKRNMLWSLAAFTAAALCVGLAACGDDDDDEKVASLVGIWEGRGTDGYIYAYTFEKNGSGTRDVFRSDWDPIDSPSHFSYEKEDKTRGTLSLGTSIYYYMIEGNSMSISKTPAGTPEIVCTPHTPLVGIWKGKTTGGNTFYMQFNKDETGTYGSYDENNKPVTYQDFTYKNGFLEHDWRGIITRDDGLKNYYLKVGDKLTIYSRGYGVGSAVEASKY